MAVKLVDEGSLLKALGFVGADPTDKQITLLRLVHPLAESVFRDWLSWKSGGYEEIVELLPGRAPRAPDVAYGDEFRLHGQSVSVVPTRLSTNELRLGTTPVWVTGLEVREDTNARAGQASGAFGDSTVLTAGTDYWLDVDDPELNLSRSGILYRSCEWPDEPRSVKVTYFGGETASRLADSAGSLRYAAMLTVIKAYKTLSGLQGGGLGPKMNESFGKYSYTNSAEVASAMAGAGFTVPPEAQAVASRFRRFAAF